MPPYNPSLACLCKSDIHVIPLLNILASGLVYMLVIKVDATVRTDRKYLRLEGNDGCNYACLQEHTMYIE